jgi:hypothetical protein
LKSAIETGKSEFSPDQVHKDDACDFGRWLHGPGMTAAKGTPDYETCRRLHADFHKAASDVLRLGVTGKKAEAQKAMGETSRYATVSAELTRAMMKWLAAAPRA